MHSLQDKPPPFSPPAPTGINEPFSRSSRTSYKSSATLRSRRAFEASGASVLLGSAFGGSAHNPREPWMIGATERQIASVATGSGSDRISKSAVVDSLREATKTLEPQLAASVQSTALSQLQADAQGSCTREEVARVWLTNVLPALERVPLRNATGGLGTRKLTQVLQHMTHGRLSQVMLDELPAAQDALGLSIDGTGGGELPNELVQPLVATLTAAALRATVHELGDSLLSLPGLEKLGAFNGGGDNEAGEAGDGGGGSGGGEDGNAASWSGSVSQADAVAAAEGLVRRMLEGALHGHHFALALAMSGDDDAAPTGEQFYASATTMSTAYGDDGVERQIPTAKDLLKLKETQAAVMRLSDENGQLVNEHNALLDEHADLHRERNELLAANRRLEAELKASREAEQSSSDRASELTSELHRSYASRDAIEADLTELRSSVKTQVVSAIEASQAAAKASYDVDMRHDRQTLERELASLRASRDAEVAANAEVQRRCERLESEKHALEVERAALLAERTANFSRSAAMQATLDGLSPVPSPRRSGVGGASHDHYGGGGFGEHEHGGGASPYSYSSRRSPLAALAKEEPATTPHGDDDYDNYPGPQYTSALRDEVRL